MENEGHEHHEHAEHVHKVHVERRRHSLRSNPWVVSTFVLALLVVLLILGNVFNITGKSVSANKAGEKLLNFATSQGLDAEITNVTSEGVFYKVILAIDGNDIPVYVTKDGKYFTSSLIPLETEEETANNNTNTNTQTQVPKTAKPAVDLFVMSYCPYGTQAEKGILPVVELLGDKIDFNLRFVYYAMHPSQGEVEENLRQYCIQKEQESKFNDYLTCFLKAGENATCLTEAKIDKTKLNACMTATDKQFQISENKNDKSKWLSGNYPLFNIDKDLNEMYNVGGSPTLVINGVTVNSARDPASYLDFICQAFSDASVPEECGEQLSTTVYSPGFGYSTTTSTTTAECG
ncbi:MAG: hypothetical protein NTZ83_02740 [Candidatus Pacearchaeota archaeon]|nr:hypothetical protein [Candidatus Pacearchaeota archaeon]